MQKYPALPVSSLAMFASVLMLAFFAAGEGFFATLPTFTPSGWMAVGFIGVSSGVGYFLWLWALRYVDATRVTIFLALNPIVATLLGFLWLGEQVSPTFLGAWGAWWSAYG